MFFFTLVNQKQEHISWTIKTKYENFIQYLPYIHHSTKKQFAVPPSFRWDFFLVQPETRIAHVDHVFCPIKMKWATFIGDLP